MLGNIIACLIVLFIVIKACSPSGGTSKRQEEPTKDDGTWTLPKGTPACSTDELYSTLQKLVTAGGNELLDGCVITDRDYTVIILDLNTFSASKIMIIENKLALWTDFSFLTSEKRVITKPKPSTSPAKATADLDTGIKPSSICNILSSKGIETSDWKPIFESDEWHCISTYIDIGQGKNGGLP